jgi:Tfp pilus assembly protein PilN
MTTTDRDGLGAVQIARINRFELARYRRTREQKRIVSPPLIGLLVGILLIACAALVLVHNRWSPGTQLPRTQLYTRLPNLNQQTPSITIYADRQ